MKQELFSHLRELDERRQQQEGTSGTGIAWSNDSGLNEPGAAADKLLQSCPTLCDPRDSSPPGSPIPGILQARTLELPFLSPMHESEK